MFDYLAGKLGSDFGKLDLALGGFTVILDFFLCCCNAFCGESVVIVINLGKGLLAVSA